MGKFSPTTVPGVFFGWHIEPGCGFRGDYIVVPLSAFRVPDKRVYHAHRIKELVTFDATQFPLQGAMLEERNRVSPPMRDGNEVWPHEIDASWDVDEVQNVNEENIDREYRDMIGEKPAADMTFEEKYRRIEKELFGEDLDDDGWANFGKQNGVADQGTRDSQADDEDDQDQKINDDVTMKNDLPQLIRPSALRKKRMNIPRSVAAPCSASSSTWTTDRHAAKDEGYQHLIRESAEPHNPAQKKFELSNRKLVEFCCGHDSLLGNDKYKARGCAIVRLTIDDDLTTVEGLRKALDEVRNSKPGQYVHLWGSLPCTGGSPWQRVNARHPNAKVNLGNHIATFNKLISGFKIVAEEVIGKGGDVSYEWPAGCTLWGTKIIPGNPWDEEGLKRQ